jgi:hypothetical protein
MSLMRTAKAVLALFVSASLASPAAAQVRAAASIAGFGAPRIALSVPLSAGAALASAPLASLSVVPALALSALPAASAPAERAAASAVAAVSPSVAVPAAAAPVLRAAALPAVGAAAALVSSPALAASPAVEAGRSSWEALWSGSAAHSEAAVAVAAPAMHDFHAVLAHAAPYAEAGAVLAGTYALARAASWGWNSYAAKRNVDPRQFAPLGFLSKLGLWSVGTIAALHAGGAPTAVMTVAYGGVLAALTYVFRTGLDDRLHGLQSLISRPFSVGMRVQIDDQIGKVTDVSLSSLQVTRDDGDVVPYSHAELAAKIVIVFGNYRDLAATRKLTFAAPKLRGALRAAWESLDRRFWLPAGTLAVFVAAHALVPAVAGGIAAKGLHWAVAGSTVWLAWGVKSVLRSMIDILTRKNGLPAETKALAQLGATAAFWAIGGGAVLSLAAGPWAWLSARAGADIGFGSGFSAGVGLVAIIGSILYGTTFFSSLAKGLEAGIQNAKKLLESMFAGTVRESARSVRRAEIGKFVGVVEDSTMRHTVLKLDETRYALVPHALELRMLERDSSAHRPGINIP